MTKSTEQILADTQARIDSIKKLQSKHKNRGMPTKAQAVQPSPQPALQPTTSVYDSRVGELRVGTQLWKTGDLAAFLKSKRSWIEMQIRQLVEDGKDDATIFSTVGNELAAMVEDFPELATIRQLITTPTGGSVRITRGSVRTTLSLSEIGAHYVQPDFPSAVQNEYGRRMKRFRFLAAKAERDRATRAKLEEKRKEQELAEAQQFIFRDSQLDPSIQRARAQMPTYAAKLRAAADIINKAKA